MVLNEINWLEMHFTHYFVQTKSVIGFKIHIISQLGVVI